MNSKHIRRHVIAKALEGQSRQQIYDDLNATYKGRELDLASIVITVPTLVQRQFWELHNRVLMGLLVFESLFLVIWFLAVPGWEVPRYMGLRLFVPILWGVMLWGIASWRPGYYRPIGVVGMVCLEEMVRSWFEFGMDAWSVVNVVIVGAMTFLGFFLGQKLVNQYKAQTEQVQLPNGQIRSKASVRFED